MTYNTYIISTKEELSKCPAFQVDNFLWNCLVYPATTGRMGYLKDQGLLIQMTCLESNPKREFKNHCDAVCRDSAMEAFFAFPDPTLRQETLTLNEVLYFNFEVNSNGAMYAKYGHGRKDRQFLTKKEYDNTGVSATLQDDKWSIELLVPNTLLNKVCNIPSMTAGDTFFCNFYKIAENDAIEHYVAWNPIDHPTPNFHLPKYFGRAIITEF